MVLFAGLASFAGLPPDVCRSATVAAFLALPFCLTALGFEDYWHPARVGDVRVGIEDILASLSSGGFIWAAAARGATGLSLQLETTGVVRRYLGTTLLGAAVFSACHLSGMLPLPATLVAMVVVSGWLLRRRPELRPLALTGMVSFAVLYVGVLKFSWVVFPAFATDWNWAGLCGVTMGGVPVEEILWAAGYGGVWSLMMGYAFQARVEPQVAPAAVPAGIQADRLSVG